MYSKVYKNGGWEFIPGIAGWRLRTVHGTAKESQSPRVQKEDASTEMGIEVIPRDVWGAEK